MGVDGERGIQGWGRAFTSDTRLLVLFAGSVYGRHCPRCRTDGRRHGSRCAAWYRHMRRPSCARMKRACPTRRACTLMHDRRAFLSGIRAYRRESAFLRPAPPPMSRWPGAQRGSVATRGRASVQGAEGVSARAHKSETRRERASATHHPHLHRHMCTHGSTCFSVILSSRLSWSMLRRSPTNAWPPSRGSFDVREVVRRSRSFKVTVTVSSWQTGLVKMLRRRASALLAAVFGVMFGAVDSGATPAPGRAALALAGAQRGTTSIRYALPNPHDSALGAIRCAAAAHA